MDEPAADGARPDERFVVELARAGAEASAGGKAAGLGQLCAAGLPVPEGFALTGAAFRAVVGARAGALPLDGVGAALAAWQHAAEEHAVPAALEADVLARARALGGPLIVRSSMAIEDGATGAAPGVGVSLGGVAPDEVWRAIRVVWAASLTPLVAIYARGGQLDDVTSPGVIVQREVAGERLTVYTRAPGRPGDDEVWLAAATDGAAPRRVVARRDDARPEIALALAAERAIAAPHGADVELVRGPAALVVVQARPLVHPAPRPRRSPPPPLVLAPLRASGRRWRRDVTHNPDPLSTAQTELCALVERAAFAPFHLAVAAGFLYDAPRTGTSRADAAAPRNVAELEARYAHAAASVDAALARVADDHDAAAVLDRALDAYLDAYRAIVELAPAIAAARRVLVSALRASEGERAALARAAALAPRRPSSLVAAVAAAARGEIDRPALLAIAGDFAPVWDVASPTFAETPALVDDAIARARARPAPPAEPEAPAELADAVAIARAAADLAERDDMLFARAQATVRRALLAVASRLGVDARDVFWIAFEDLRAAPPGADDLARWRERVAARASAARSAAGRAAAWEMPLVIAPDDGPAGHARDAAGHEAAAWTGDGLGGRAAGPVARLDGLGGVARVPRGAVVVTRAVTPAMALLIEGAAAIVCEHGSLLDHGAAMAREMGIPCVVGCAGVVDAVIDDEWLEVDGDAGRVARVSRP